MQRDQYQDSNSTKGNSTMKKRNLVLFVAVFLTILLCVTAWAAGGHGHKAPKKVGILLVAFGSSEASAQVSFENPSITLEIFVTAFQLQGDSFSGWLPNHVSVRHRL